MQTREFKQVDVFTGTPYYGNALAVVVDGTGLTDGEMQRFARWTNLSETSFLLPPRSDAADYHVRIFTPGGELPFAGHPTLGSCHAWLEAGGKPRQSECVVQECGVGRVRIRRDGKRLAFAAPPLKRSAPGAGELAQIAQAIGVRASQVIAAQMLDNGPVWTTLLLDSPQTVLGLTPNHTQLKSLGHKVGVAAVYAQAPEAGPHLEVRAFAAAIGIAEDPVTGSLNASLAQWLIEAGHVPQRYLAAQGACLGRAGRVHLERDTGPSTSSGQAPSTSSGQARSTSSGQVWVGGESVTCINGSVVL